MGAKPCCSTFPTKSSTSSAWCCGPRTPCCWPIALILAATGLFLVTALAGRLFCGFACPQTVYTSIFMWVETRVEGDHLARLQASTKAPSSPAQAGPEGGTKHALWLL
jgi:polyferredoxin